MSLGKLSSYVGEQLLAAGYADAVVEYGLAAFEFNVLSLGRTFAEKVMALVLSLPKFCKSAGAFRIWLE